MGLEERSIFVRAISKRCNLEGALRSTQRPIENYDNLRNDERGSKSCVDSKPANIRNLLHPPDAAVQIALSAKLLLFARADTLQCVYQR